MRDPINEKIVYLTDNLGRMRTYKSAQFARYAATRLFRHHKNQSWRIVDHGCGVYIIDDYACGYVGR